MTTDRDIDPQAAAGRELARLADTLEAAPEAAWEAPSLCEGWRVREVAAHMTMAARYQPTAFLDELEACHGDFTLLSNRVAARDGALPVATLLGNLRDEGLHRWAPPGGGPVGALTHAVVHALDITCPLGIERPADPALLAVLDHLSIGGGHAHFGVDLAGRELRATDADWSSGDGPAIVGTAADLVLWACARTLPPGRITEPPSR